MACGTPILDGADAAAFRSMFEDLHDDLVRFVERRTGPAGAEDVAAVAAGLVVLPPWGAPDHAFATWTAVPEEVPATELENLLGQLPCDPGSSGGPSMSSGDVVLAEERGDITFVVTASPVAMAHCLLVDGHPTAPAGEASWKVRRAWGRRTSTLSSPSAAARAPRDIWRSWVG
ncbi:hypothetical protein FE374_06650 [Georgenia yuyongxinii]|uniref:Uncharacterized protein n=1 Tax=Georgenia yuyongxinii TaxID=2589797 RepID=A0A5B8C2I6_9MICO|nr:hypothetical protein [Georgenia yuyongxinii]QDC24347.1 hypothetical protein FE374_06650 [Georgenia yuyongxinii]